MNKSQRILIGLAFLSSANISHADSDRLLEMCKLAITPPAEIEKNPILAGIDIGFCLGYLRGVSDYATGTAPMTSEQLAQVKSCRPESVDNKQLAKIVVKYLDNNPQFHHMEQTTLVALALKDAFPCE